MARSNDTMRQCALTRTEMPVAKLIRFAESPQGDIVPDVDGKAPGRGVWITLSSAAVDEAIRKKVFSKSLKAQVDVPADLALMTRSRLEQRLTGALGLARKAGALVTGAAKVAALVEKRGAAALITASDAAPDSRRKMLQSVRRAYETPEGLEHIESLASDQLGLALGLENVIHAALIPGAAANSVMERANRLARFIATDREEDGTI
ncbi:RNA-binding protein [Pelagibacterium limicola]|uniref:RNA-binding protein n=1 Tax=Pelagibacterium limicola TaxID=2791022 RepID=UPI0018AFC1FF